MHLSEGTSAENLQAQWPKDPHLHKKNSDLLIQLVEKPKCHQSVQNTYNLSPNVQEQRLRIEERNRNQFRYVAG